MENIFHQKESEESEEESGSEESTDEEKEKAEKKTKAKVNCRSPCLLSVHYLCFHVHLSRPAGCRIVQ